MSKQKIGYLETDNKLQIRIQAHKEYSNFSLDDWLLENLPLSKGGSVLDIGCGNGNFFSIYDEKLGGSGLVVGLDQSTELLEKGWGRDIASKKLLLKWDMNDVLPFIQQSFDHVISTFAIYYVDDVERILSDMAKVLKEQSSFTLIGPTDSNARELYDFNEKIFGIPRDEKINIRTNRLETEFFPAASKFFKDVSKDIVPSKLAFPGIEEFVNYYLATLLYEESCKKTGKNPTKDELIAMVGDKPEISKEMIVVRGFR